MKKLILLALFGALLSTNTKASIVLTSPTTTTTVNVSNATDWNNIAWTSTGSGSDTTYVISPNFTIHINVSTVKLGNDTIVIKGTLDFANGNSNLVLLSRGYIDVKAGGQITGGNNTATNIAIGSGCDVSGNGSSNATCIAQVGPFNIQGPVSSDNDVPFPGATTGTDLTAISAPSSICMGSSMTVTYTASAAFTSTNVLTVQLSNSTGSFSSPVTIGTLTSTASTGSITATIPSYTISSNGYFIRVVSTNNISASPQRSITLNAPISISATSSTICSGNSTTLSASETSSYSWMPGGSTTSSITVTPSSSTTYTLTGSGNSCSNTATKTIVVNALPSVTANASSQAVCVGGSTTLTGGGATSYIWSGGVNDGISFVPSTSTTYTVTGTDANTCVNTQTITITVNALPTLTINATASTINSGNSTTMVASGASSYLWMPGSLSTVTVTVSPTVTTTYTITGTDENICSNTTTKTITVNPASGNGVWNGSVDTDWNNTSNWGNGVPPSASVNGVIPSGQPRYPIIAGNFNVKKITVQSGASITINTGFSLTLSDSLVNNGSISLKSGASLVQGNSSYLGGTGIYNVERTLVGSTASFVSSPINNQPVGNFGITPTGQNGGQNIPESNCDPAHTASGSPWGILQELHEDANILFNCSQSLWFVKSAGTLENGRGYSLWGGGTANLTFNGTVNNGPISYTGLTRQSGAVNNADGTTIDMGWHLVGNPYPSPITINGGDLFAMGFDAQVQVYNNGQWISSLGASLPVGQGFQIHKTDVGGTSDFTLTNSNREAGNPAFRSNTVQHFLNIVLNDSTRSDKTFVYFNEGATGSFDPRYDANRFNDAKGFPMVYTLSNNDKQLSYNALPSLGFDEIDSVKLSIRPAKFGTHTLTFNDVSAIGANVVLEDLKLGTVKEITDGTIYSFNRDSTDSNNRFVLRFRGNIAPEPILVDNSGNDGGTPIALGVGVIQNNNIKLAPNPTSGTTTLSLPTNHGFNKLTITNLIGVVVQTYQLNSTETSKTLNTDELNTGIYLIKLSGINNQTIIKLIKQ